MNMLAGLVSPVLLVTCRQHQIWPQDLYLHRHGSQQSVCWGLISLFLLCQRIHTTESSSPANLTGVDKMIRAGGPYQRHGAESLQILSHSKVGLPFRQIAISNLYEIHPSIVPPTGRGLGSGASTHPSARRLVSVRRSTTIIMTFFWDYIRLQYDNSISNLTYSQDA